MPYGVKCKWEDEDLLHKGGGILYDVCKVKTSTGFVYWDCYFEDEDDDIPIEIVKPYLRPMSSMTEEECKELRGIIIAEPLWSIFDFFYSHHIDFRDLIPNGLALEAPADMYNTK